MKNKTVLVTGGAGYIGSHTSFVLAQQGYNVVIIDKLLHGQQFNFPWATFIKADFADEKVLKDVFLNYKIDAVIHFAALIEVGLSVESPHLFYENNVVKTLKLLDVMRENGVRKIIFSSSCAVYGDPVRVPMDEEHLKNPISPYGKNKLVVEYVLEDYARAYGLQYVSLRYFNSAGAFPEQNLGEQHDPETHIIPLLFRSIRNKTPFYVFGSDYATPDGTCVRDYIHVRDLADAHLKAYEHVNATHVSDVFNLGTGRGYSVRELVLAAGNVCGQKAIVICKERRDGDVDALVADPSKATNILGWSPQFSSLDFILKSALKFEEINLAKVQYEQNNIRYNKLL
jgi:UDP-glucose 4-epimerase